MTRRAPVLAADHLAPEAHPYSVGGDLPPTGQLGRATHSVSAGGGPSALDGHSTDDTQPSCAVEGAFLDGAAVSDGVDHDQSGPAFGDPAHGHGVGADDLPTGQGRPDVHGTTAGGDLRVRRRAETAGEIGVAA